LPGILRIGFNDQHELFCRPHHYSFRIRFPDSMITITCFWPRSITRQYLLRILSKIFLIYILVYAFSSLLLLSSGALSENQIPVFNSQHKLFFFIKRNLISSEMEHRPGLYEVYIWPNYRKKNHNYPLSKPDGSEYRKHPKVQQ
jgi:hypothetical protein